MSGFRLPAEVLVGWKDQLTAQRGAADDALQDVLRALQAEGPDGHVVVTRHQLFSWAQAVEGAARKGRPQLEPLAADMRSYLRDGPGTPVVAPVAPPPPTAPRVEPAPIVYQRVGPAPGAPAGGTRLLTEREIGGYVSEMLRDARSEVIVVSPWGVGLDSLVNALLQVPPNVTVRILTRRPPQEDEAYHRGVVQLRKRNVDVVFSNHVQTRLVVTDAQRLVFGAASLPGPLSREAAVATTDAALVQAARDNALRLLEEARQGR